MNKLFNSFLIITSSFFILSCGQDDDGGTNPDVTDYSYHAHVHSPNSDDKHLGDKMEIHVEFESHTGEAVHHVNVRIYNKSDETELYNQPEEAHVHEMDGVYEFSDEITLSEANGFSEHSNYILEAKVWGHDDTEGEVSETVEFHIHP